MLEVFGTRAAFARHADLVAHAASVDVPVTPVDDAVMAGLSETVTPQGIVAVCATLDTTLDAVAESVRRGAVSLVAVLAEIRDPGNAGTVLRTADAAGAGAVVFAGSSVDPYNGKCVRASAGSLFHLPVVRGVSVAATVDRLRRAGLRVLAADAAGEVALDEMLSAGRLDGGVAWVFGNEARGLPDEVAAAADERVRIPIYGHAESLNLAAAAAICLYASAQAQRRGRPEAGRGRER